jgi:hypothetical protein
MLQHPSERGGSRSNVAPDTIIDFEATRTGLGFAGPLGYRVA